VEVCKRLRRSREYGTRRLSGTQSPARHSRAANAQEHLEAVSCEDGIDELLDLLRIDAAASNGKQQYYEFCRAKQKEFGAGRSSTPLIRGQICSTSATRPAAVRKILDAVEEKQLEGELTSRDEALGRG